MVERKNFCVFLLIFLLVSCNSKEKVKINKGFYYWKSNFVWKTEDTNIFGKQYQAEKLYLRLFDVDWQQNTAQPIGTCSIEDSIPKAIQIIPVVFITQNVVLQIPTIAIEDLAKKIVSKVFNTLARQNIDKTAITELQIDCDWTSKSQKTYFALLKAIKKEVKTNKECLLSCTIRLYPMKYFKKMGIPPVDKGVLMCYNLENPTVFAKQNSILSYTTAKEYLRFLSAYPLPVDIALPIFAWSVQFRNGKFLRLLTEIRQKDVVNNSNFKQIQKNYYQATQTNVLENRDILAGDILRIDETSITELTQTAAFIQENVATKLPNRNIILFHYDKEILSNYSNKEINTVFTIFGQQ
jgi:hypothetical protein